MTCQIITFNTGFIAVDKGAYITRGKGIGIKVEIPAIAWLIKSDNETILVDTGMCNTKRAQQYHHPGSYQPKGFDIK